MKRIVNLLVIFMPLMMKFLNNLSFLSSVPDTTTADDDSTASAGSSSVTLPELNAEEAVGQDTENRQVFFPSESVTV